MLECQWQDRAGDRLGGRLEGAHFAAAIEPCRKAHPDETRRSGPGLIAKNPGIASGSHPHGRLRRSTPKPLDALCSRGFHNDCSGRNLAQRFVRFSFLPPESGSTTLSVPSLAAQDFNVISYRIARSPGRQRAFRFVRRRNLVVVHEVLALLENVLDGTAFLCADLPNNSNVGSRRSIWPSFSSRWCSKACHNRPSRRHRPSWATICKFAFLPTILEGIQETVL